MEQEQNTTLDSDVNHIYAETIAAGTLMVLINIIAFVGNILVIAAILKTYQLRYSLANLFVVNLCVLDLIGALMVLPVSTLTFIRQGWPWDESLCKVSGFINTFVVCATILNLSFISIERFYSIKMPMHHAGHMTLIKTVGIIVLIWIASALLACFPLFKWNYYIFKTSKVHCSYSWDPTGYHRNYVTMISTLCFVLPGCTILIMYFGIFCVAKKASNQIQPHSVMRYSRSSPVDRPFSTDVFNASGIPIVANPIIHHFPNRNVVFKRSHAKALKTLIIIVLGFFFLWGPYFVLQFFVTIKGKMVADVFWEVVTTWLGYFSFAINPFIYGWMNRSIRQALLGIMKCCEKPDATNLQIQVPDIEDLFDIIDRTNGRSAVPKNTTIKQNHEDKDRSHQEREVSTDINNPYF